MPVKCRIIDIAGRVCALTLALNGLALGQGQKDADEAAYGSQVSDESHAPAWAQHHVLVLQGLPGDAEHAESFQGVVTSWTDWLTSRGTRPENILILKGKPSDEAATRPATRESITQTFSDLSQQLGEGDSFWLMLLGHANHDGQHAYFHIPGPDLRAVDFADLLEDVSCREQVLWLTTASSGWFLEPLSRPERVVIAATQADAEPNETEFPAALAEAMRTAEVDVNGDQRISLLELFAQTVQRVEARYKADDRSATEHAMLDDNGDGRGTEWKEIQARIERIQSDSDEPPPRPADGEVATRILIPSDSPTDVNTQDTPEAASEEDFQE